MLLWLLERGWAGSRDGGGVEARRALANLLRDPGVAPDVLGLPGAVPWLVLMLTGDAEEGGDTSGLSNAVLEATARIHVLDDPSSKDVEFTVAALKGSGRGGGARLAAWALASWARGSEEGREKVVNMGALRVLAGFLGGAEGGTDGGPGGGGPGKGGRRGKKRRGRGQKEALESAGANGEEEGREGSSAPMDMDVDPRLHQEACEAVSSVARAWPATRPDPRFRVCVEPLVQIFEQASRGSNGSLAAQSMFTLAEVLKAGGPAAQADAAACGLHSLLADICQECGGLEPCELSLQLAVSQGLACMVDALDPEQRASVAKACTARMLEWLMEAARTSVAMPAASNAALSRTIAANIVEVLTTLSQGDKREMLLVERWWLAALLESLHVFYDLKAQAAATEDAATSGGWVGALELYSDKAESAREAFQALSKAAMQAAESSDKPNEAPLDIQEMLKSKATELYPALAATVDEAVAESTMVESIGSIVSLVTEDPTAQAVLVRAGSAELLKCLIRDNDGVDSVKDGLQDEAIRMLAMLSAHNEVLQDLEDPCNEGLRVQIKQFAKSDYLDLSNNAAKILLHMEGSWARRDERLAREMPLTPVFHENVNLFNPGAEHHRALAKEGQDSPGGPVMDVVFIHGLKGGPFDTWRTDECTWSYTPPERTVASYWPACWLSKDLPEARLLALSYPSTFWETERSVHPIEEQANIIRKSLRQAGVGDRPVVFVCHSLGGLIIKEMLVQAEEGPIEDAILDQLHGIVMFSTPHFGSDLAGTAIDMKLFSSKSTIHDLKPSEGLEDLNQRMSTLVRKYGTRCLSFGEGQGTPLVTAGNLAKRINAVVVSLESAFPGYGDFVLLEEFDHVNGCKPKSKDALAYQKTLEFLCKRRDSLAAAAPANNTVESISAAGEVRGH